MKRIDINSLIRRVDLLTLKLFLTVIEEGQLAKAASREHIVPSAVTKRIQELEEQIGAKLFDRAPKGMSLTSAGRIVARHVRTIFADLTQMRDEINLESGGPRGYIRLAANESIIIEFIANEIHRFTSEYPDIEVELLPQPAPDVSRHLQLGAADIGIFASYGSSLDIVVQEAEVREFRTDQLVAVVPRGHALASQSDITLRDLMNAGLIGLRSSSPFMDNLRKAADKEGYLLRSKYEVSTNEAARALVRAGLGVSVQPRGAIRIEDYDQITLVALNQSWATRRLSLAVKDRHPLSEAVATFVEQLSQFEGARTNGRARNAAFCDPYDAEGFGAGSVREGPSPARASRRA